jgi:hypothetical protein
MNTITIDRTVPVLELGLLLRFLVQRFDELLQEQYGKVPPHLQALMLSALVPDIDEHNRLKSHMLAGSCRIEDCRDALVLALRNYDPDGPVQLYDKESGVSLSERSARTMLFCALLEVRRLIANPRYEFLPIIRTLGWIALQPYRRRLVEFEEIWDSSLGDAQILDSADNVLRAAFRRKDEDDPELDRDPRHESNPIPEEEN